MARNPTASDVGVGSASFTTRLQLTIQAARKCLKYGALPAFIIPWTIWGVFVSPQNFDFVKLRTIAAYAPQDVHRKWFLRDETGERRVITVKSNEGKLVQYFTPAEIRAITDRLSGTWSTFLLTLLGSVVAGSVGYYVFWRYFEKMGSYQQKNKRLRGAYEVVSGEDLNRLVRAKEPARYTICDVAIPDVSVMLGILANGAQGSGKSLALHDFYTQIIANKKKAVVYDPTGEFYQAYFRPGIDAFFNPALEGSVPFSVFEEIQYAYDANTLAQAFLPPKGVSAQQGPNAFFEDAARAVFSVIILRLAERGAEDTCDIARAFLDMPEEEMSLLIQKSVASSAIGGDSKGQRQGVIASVAIYLDGIAAVNRGKWSMRKFLAQDNDARLYITGTDDTNAMFTPLYRLMIAVAHSSISAMREVVHYDRYWFVLDEIHKLGDIRIDEVLAEKRKYGVAVIAGTQNDSQFVTSIGKDRAETTLNGFNTFLQLRANDSDSKDRASKRIDKMESQTVSQNQAVAVREDRDGAGIVINEQEKWAVMSGDFGQLDVCCGYLKIPGNFPVGRVDYRHWLKSTGGKPARIDRFKGIQPGAPRAERFVVKKSQLPPGQSAFDGVKREAEDLKKAQAAEAKQAMTATAAQTNIVPLRPGVASPEQQGVSPTAVDMANSPTTDVGSDENKRVQSQQIDLEL